ncbi:efflux transporter outer membrane subunit [Sphingomonas nostoxanthinifaciens]|uniref:efflux transporter outer membrane subunit n=1 Tax=Sphingomonas nostoxanthinifaciens TaxID=2872652 RepID=UPI001CC1DB25|nr:efflux transporter outer membrane subunit [Sphingomonas nostoxanthinifaciens]UAK25174.1 efflux transporter outer membrane subunit [Sphingomonas nostoxanthinifaciens]
MKRAVLPFGAAALLAGCTVGPHNVTTQTSLPPTAAANASAAPIAPAAGPTQTIVPGAVVPADWWTRFGSPTLNALVARALASNNDIATADAALRQARQQAAAAFGSTLPQIDASYQAQRIRTSRIFSNPLQDPDNYRYTLHTAQVTVAYPLDLFGAGRNRVRSARAAAEVQRHRLEAAKTSVVANLVLAVIQQASLQEQIASATESVRANRDILTLLQRREQLGAIGAADVAAQETALATAEGVLPPLQRALVHQQAVISALIGQAPGNTLPALPTLAELGVPTELPLSLPADLVRHRPDVRAAESQMIGAGADVGAAIAARLPNIQLSASAGGVADQFGQMFASGNPFWTLAGGITQPLFHGGQLLHQQRAAQAALDGAKSQYRAAVVQAFVDVSDALTGLQTDGVALDAASRADTAAARELTFITRQLQLGSAGTLNLLNASAARAQAGLQLTQARAARLSDSVALFQALGGGW